MDKLRSINKWSIGIMGVVLGVMTILGIRFVTYVAPTSTHYHANFAVYVDGKQEQFDSNPLIYADVTECTENVAMTPTERAHLHENIKDVVHVEDEAVTWGNFFQNIGWNVDYEYMSTPKSLLADTDTKKVSYILNGEVVSDISARVISDKDRLLVSYGTSTKDEINKQFATVASTDEKYDIEKDPASCSGGHSDNSAKARISHLL